MKILTDRQRQIYEYVRGYTKERGFPPSVRDICRHFDIQSPQGAQRHLNALEKKGYIKRDPGLARSLSLVSREDEAELHGEAKSRLIPVIGEVAAGAPILAQEDIIEELPFAVDWLNSNKKYFFLKIKGDSMAEAIQPGDLILVERDAQPTAGDIVVALLEDEATCKRFFPEKGRVILRSDNPRYDDIVVDRNFSLIGRVKALMRKYP
jgi:repressor LexA